MTFYNIFRLKTVLWNCNNIAQYEYFTVFFNQINAALSKGVFLQKIWTTSNVWTCQDLSIFKTRTQVNVSNLDVNTCRPVTMKQHSSLSKWIHTAGYATCQDTLTRKQLHPIHSLFVCNWKNMHIFINNNWWLSGKCTYSAVSIPRWKSSQQANQ